MPSMCVFHVFNMLMLILCMTMIDPPDHHDQLHAANDVVMYVCVDGCMYVMYVSNVTKCNGRYWNMNE